MAFLIVQIRQRCSGPELGPTVAQLCERHAAREPLVKTVRALAARNGWEATLPCMRVGPEWTNIARVYISPNATGLGRSGSQVWSYVCRKIQKNDEPQRR